MQEQKKDSASTIRGGQAIAQLLRSMGISDIFALPGSQTMGLYDELARMGGFTLHTALQDACAVGMADGAARASGRLSTVILYEFAGVANAAGTIYSALVDKSPMVILGTLADSRQSGRQWSVESANTVGYVQQITKLALEVPRADRLIEMIRRAIRVAMTPPFGPVYVGIPADFFIAPIPDSRLNMGELSADTRNFRSIACDQDKISSICELVLKEEKVAFVAGADVADSGAISYLEELSELLALPVFIEPFAARMPISSDHAFNFRSIRPDSIAYWDANLVVAIGAKIARRFLYMPFEFIRDNQKFVHVHVDQNEIGRVYPVDIGLVADSRSALVSLLSVFKDRIDKNTKNAIEKRRARLELIKNEFDLKRKAIRQDRQSESPADPASTLYLIGKSLRNNDVIVDETIGLRFMLPNYMDIPVGANYFGTNAGFMGWGPGAASGVGLLKKREKDGGKVVMLAGDGCFVMTPQALWNAAKENLPVVFVVMNNQGWVSLKNSYDIVRKQSGVPIGYERIGCDLDEPPIDYVSVAKGFGVPGKKIESSAEVPDAMEEALKAIGPFLIDIRLQQHSPSYPQR